ncbi:MAG: tyrosine-type recombinase/integrase, partial [Bryobacterales bacterium]|nr:tyrosine-type recombinase/integrase [Bryobacterales bacterium]
NNFLPQLHISGYSTYLYNSGARATEAAGLRVEDLHLPERTGESARATIHGKGGKIRITPIWTRTAKALAALSGDRPPGCRSVFWSRHRKPYTRHREFQFSEDAGASDGADSNR